jgi:hypothetical protein
MILSRTLRVTLKVVCSSENVVGAAYELRMSKHPDPDVVCSSENVVQVGAAYELRMSKHPDPESRMLLPTC